MAINTTLSTVVLFNAAIADTAAHNSIPAVLDYLNETAVMAVSTLNQSVTISTQYSDDGGTTWTTIGTTYSLAASGSVVANQYDQTLTGIKMFAGMLRFVATAATAPTSGNLKITFQGMSA